MLIVILKDDLLKLSFYGNYDYQGDTLDFSETSIRIDRYQQYKLGYNFNMFKNNISWNIKTFPFLPKWKSSYAIKYR